jgi:hypothetical protein
MKYWVGVAGTSDDPLPDDWRPKVAEWEKRHGLAHFFSRPPSVRAGDRLVMYATGSPRQFGVGRFFAIREVISNPEPSGRKRWPWKVRLRDVVTGPNLERCPTIEEIGVGPKSVRRQTHIKLDREAGLLAEELLSRSSSTASGRLVSLWKHEVSPRRR